MKFYVLMTKEQQAAWCTKISEFDDFVWYHDIEAAESARQFITLVDVDIIEVTLSRVDFQG